MRRINIKGAIFDLDGTIIDSMGVWDKIDYDYLNKRNIPYPENLGAVIKNMSYDEAALYFQDKFGITDSADHIINEWKDMAYYEYAHDIKLKSGVERYLTYLRSKGVRIGLATSTIKKLSEAVLENNGIAEYFVAVTTLKEVKRNKNFPDIYILTAEKLNVEPKECAVFEDILPGVMSAKAAGMTAVGVYDFYSASEWEDIKKHADKYIYSFVELLDLEN